jgi:hypothetical protein
MKRVSSKNQGCPNCGENNLCQSQQIGEFICWCQRVELTDENRAKIKALGFSAECLCLPCLDLMSKDAP